MSEYKLDERVLAYHGPMLYDAKILKLQDFPEAHGNSGEMGWHYFVHYKGWKRTWDEWIPASRLLKDNEVNRQLLKDLQLQYPRHGAVISKAKPSGSKDKKPTVGSSSSRGTKRAREEDDGYKRPEMILEVPELLKAFLVDDWEAVTKNNQLVSLPRNPTVEDILKEFQDWVIETHPPTIKDPKILAPTVVAGLRMYFDKSLGNRLLYRFERAQYAQTRTQYITGQHVIPGKPTEMSSLYGAEHLVRMLAILPEMISHTNLDAESVALIRDYTNELLNWLADNKARLFMSEYENSPNSYQAQIAKG